MLAGTYYKAFDKKLGKMTAVGLEKTDAGYSISNVFGRLKNNIVVKYIEKCVQDEFVSFHKVSHSGKIFYIVENKKYGCVNFENLHLQPL